MAATISSHESDETENFSDVSGGRRTASDEDEALRRIRAHDKSEIN